MQIGYIIQALNAVHTRFWRNFDTGVMKVKFFQVAPPDSFGTGWG